MHSMKEKFKYFMKIQHELYDVIYDNLDMDNGEILKIMKEHLTAYNEKYTVYLFTLVESIDFTSEYKFIMY